MTQAFQFTREAQEYAWREIIRRAGVAAENLEALGLCTVYGLPEGPTPAPGVYISPCDPQDWPVLLTAARVDWIDPTDVFPSGAADLLPEALPVLFWGVHRPQPAPFAELRPDGCLVVYADLLAGAFFLLSRWEEMVSAERDEHGRFPVETCASLRLGFLDRPVVDEYGLVLRAWLQRLSPDWTPVVPEFRVQLSHDVDHVFKPTSFFKGLKTLTADLFVERSAAHFAADCASLLRGKGVFPLTSAVEQLAQASLRNGLSSTFYFMAAQATHFDDGYDISGLQVRALLGRLHERGFKIGLHPGYDSLNDVGRLLEEKQRLEAALGSPCTAVRQHYLRLTAPHTWAAWEQAGFQTDSSMTFSGHEGFRCGTCWQFPLFDVHQNRVLSVEEIPLVVMDATLRQYRNLTIAAGRARILQLARRCKAVNGTFTLLWHNTSLIRDWFAWGRMYMDVLPELSALQKGG